MRLTSGQSSVDSLLIFKKRNNILKVGYDANAARVPPGIEIIEEGFLGLVTQT